MGSRTWLVSVLFLLVSMPMATAVNAAQADNSTSFVAAQHRLVEDASLSEEERLVLAAEHWAPMPQAQRISVELTESTGIIHMASGSFDPLASAGPEVPFGFSRLSDAAHTGMVMLQMVNQDAILRDAVVESFDLEVLDILHDEAWLVRLPPAPGYTLDDLMEQPEVRWVGHQQPGWRVAPDVLSQPSSYNVLTVVPTPDLGLGGYEALATDIVRYGADEAACDAWSCSVNFSPEHAMILVQNLAHDGRVLWTEAGLEMRVHNALAWSIAGVQSVANNATFTLDGSGEMIAIADTGLDANHPDLTGRVAATYTQFGLDPSPADSNQGHGTHIAITVLGNGTGDPDARGVAPAANLVMYALEHDPTGVFGRIGSIYDMLRDAEQMTARLSVNAWGLNGNYGQYTADARSVDQFVHDRKDLTPIFSVGDRGASGPSQVTSPSTAKNVIAVGASTTGASGTQAPGYVANFSALGPSLDGRVKPDLVAPGVGICSGLAEEAQNPAGGSCLSGSHASGNSYYMALTGTSQATAVASGIASLTREFIREQAGVSSPSSAIVKAAMINGAKDLGASDIPNSAEGWGQVDLERTVMPMDGSVVLDTFFDDKKVLESGFGLLYSFSIEPAHGLDLTLTWTDEAGSANAAQTQPRLVNNLDLVVVSPDGTEWLGNQFSQGFSTSGGTADDLNNVERIRIAPGTLSGGNGDWIVKVLHRGGTQQDFALVMTAKATPTPQADLVVFDGSILTSSASPLKDDLISIRLAWANQGTSASPGFDILLEDTTAQTTLATSSRPSLDPGMIDSYTIFHQFTTTGVHTLKLSVDTGNSVTEINDASSGIDNNILILPVEVTALGVRVVVENDDGTLPQTSEERSSNAQMTLDVRNDSGISVPLSILHEGTGNQSVTLSATMVQIPVPGRDNFFLPSPDLWTRTFNETGNFVLTAQGTEDANKSLVLRLEDIDADLTTDPNNPRYVRSGTYVVEVSARYEFQPTVAHTQRITIEVEQLDQVQVVAAGTIGLEAEPGDSTIFSISVRNTGNAPAQYSMECISENRWQLMLGGSNSSQLDFEPLNILEYLPMSIRVIVPLVANGLPAAGDTDTVSCFVTSMTDPNMNFSEVVTISVLPQESFEVHLKDDDGDVGPNHLSSDVAVDSGQQVNLNLTIENTGNIGIDLSVSVLPDNPQWATQLNYDGEQDTRRIDITLGPGEVGTMNFIFAVPITAEEGDSNGFNIRTERSLSNFRQNITKLVVKDELGISLTPPTDSRIDASIDASYSFGEFTVKNTGNTDLILNWTHGLAPDGWQVGFANPSLYLEPREEKIVRFGLIPPSQTPTTSVAFEILVSVNATNDGRFVDASEMITVGVVPSTYGNLTAQGEGDRLLQGVSREDGLTQIFLLRNDGNTPLSGSLEAAVLDKEGVERTDWSIKISPSTVDDLAVGEVLEVEITVSPKDDVDRSSGVFALYLINNDVLVSTIEMDISVSTATGSSGLFSVLPPGVSAALMAVVLIAVVVVARRMKKSGELSDDSADLVAPNTHGRPDLEGERRNEALDLGTAVDEITSGEVSDEEIAKAIMQSMELPATPAPLPTGLPPSGLPPRAGAAAPLPLGLPPLGMPPASKSLPPLPQPAAAPAPQPAPVVATGPPLPPGGLPVGWTMEQWQHYGQEWLDRQG